MLQNYAYFGPANRKRLSAAKSIQFHAIRIDPRYIMHAQYNECPAPRNWRQICSYPAMKKVEQRLGKITDLFHADGIVTKHIRLIGCTLFSDENQTLRAICKDNLKALQHQEPEYHFTITHSQ